MDGTTPMSEKVPVAFYGVHVSASWSLQTVVTGRGMPRSGRVVFDGGREQGFLIRTPLFARWKALVGVLLVGLSSMLVGTTQAMAMEGLVIHDTEITARPSENRFAAEMQVINVSSERVPLPRETQVGDECWVRIPNPIVEPLRSATVELDIDSRCFRDPNASLVLDLDAAEDLTPVIVIRPPSQEQSNWTAAWYGMGIGAALAVAIFGVGIHAHRKAIAPLSSDDQQKDEREYARLKELINLRVGDLGKDGLVWSDLGKQRFHGKYPFFKGSVANLEAGWSLKDSMISNLTFVTAALVTLVTSIDAATAILGTTPKSVFSVMATVSLLAAVIIALATLIPKILPPGVEGQSPLGLTVSVALVVGASTMQSVALGISAASLVSSSSQSLFYAVLAITAVVSLAIFSYGWRSLERWIVNGVPPKLPLIPLGVSKTWRATEDWQRGLIYDQIKTTYKRWLKGEESVSVDYPDWRYVSGFGATSWGDDSLKPLIRARSSLL